jgi:thiol-disulfide isomerase/thioredoxin
MNLYAEKLGSTRIGATNYQIPVSKGVGEFSFRLENDLSYIHVESKRWPRLWMDNMLVEPGDDITIAIDTSGKKIFENIWGGGLKATGHGAAKYQAGFNINRSREIRNKEENMQEAIAFLKQSNMESRWVYYDTGKTSSKKRFLKELAVFEKEMSPQAFATMKANICYEQLGGMLSNVWSAEWSQSFQSPDSVEARKKLMVLYEQKFRNEEEMELTREEGRSHSWAYIDYQVRKTFSLARITDPNRFSRWQEAPAYLPFMEIVGGRQFDRLATGFMAYLASFSIPTEHPEVLIHHIMLKGMKDPYKRILDDIGERFFTIRPCYLFSLTGLDGKKVLLKDLKGKKLLIDFWFTGCLPCMQLAPRLKELNEQLKVDSSFLLVSICMDEDRKRWQESVASGKYTTSDHLNLYTEGLRERHPFLQYYGITSVPKLLLIDRNGNMLDFNVGRPGSSEDVLKLAERIKSIP